MATISQKFRKIKESAQKSGATPTTKTAAKLVSNYAKLSASAKKAAMAAIDKAYENLTTERKDYKIAKSFQELYAMFLKEFKGDKPRAAWKVGTANDGAARRDIVKDAGREATQKKGKRVVKTKGYTSNQYGEFKNKVGTTYYENRSNRFDINRPNLSKKKVKLAYGGMAKEGMMTKSKAKTSKMPTKAEFSRMSEREQKAVFAKWAESQGLTDINSPNFMFSKGGSVKKKK